MSLSAVTVELRASIHEFSSKMDEAGKHMEKLAKKGASSFDKMAVLGKAAFLGIAGGAVALGAVSLEMADTFEKSHARLEGAMKSTGATVEEFAKPLAVVNKALERFGYTNAVTESALAMLTRATHDPTKALGEMALAADIAKGRNIDLEEATSILVKVQTGHVGLLGRLGINTKDVNGKVISQTEAMKRLAEMYGGQAKISAETFAGKQQAVRAQLEDVAAKIGVALIPVLEKMLVVTRNVIDWMEKHRTATELLAGVIGGVLVAAMAVWVGTLVKDTAVAVFNFGKMIVAGATWVVAQATSMAESIALWWMYATESFAAATAAVLPFILIVAAVALVAVAGYELYKHWDTVWSAVKTATSAAWSFIKKHMGMIAIALGPLGIAAFELYKHWDRVWSAIKTATSAAWAAIKPTLTFLVDVGLWPIRTAIGLLERAWAKSWDVVKTVAAAAWTVLKPVFGWISTVGIAGVKAEIQVFSAIWAAVWGGVVRAVRVAWDFIRPLVDQIGGAVSKAVDLANKLRDAAGFVTRGTNDPLAGWKPPGAKALGGPVSAGGTYWVGERGPELLQMGSGGGGNIVPNHRLGGGGGTTVINVYGATDTMAAAREVEKMLARLRRERGTKLAFT